MSNNDDPRAEIARTNIRIAAAMRNMNLSEVSRQAGMSRNGIGQYVAGTTNLSYTNMLKVCDVLRLPIGLMHRADTMTEGRIRIMRALERMPDHLLAGALEEVNKTKS